MIYIKCPVCAAYEPVIGDMVQLDQEHAMCPIDGDRLDDFVHEHLPHLGTEYYFEVVDSVGTC